MPKPPRKITKDRLHNVAAAYLERFSAPRAHVKRLLLKRVDKAIAVHGGERSEFEPWVDEVVDTFVRLGVIDDDRYAESRARTLVAGGRSGRNISSRLYAKGVTSETIATAMATIAEDGDPSVRACAAYVRRRRLGPFRDPASRAAEREKDLARLGRAGFPYGIARETLDLPTAEDVCARIGSEGFG